MGSVCQLFSGFDLHLSTSLRLFGGGGGEGGAGYNPACPVLRTGFQGSCRVPIDVGSLLLSNLQLLDFSVSPYSSQWVLKRGATGQHTPPHYYPSGLSHCDLSKTNFSFASPCVWFKENIFCCFSSSPLQVTGPSSLSQWPICLIHMVLDLHLLDLGLFDFSGAAVMPTQ